MEIEFNSQYELFKKVLPALKTKKRELKKKGILVSEKDIFSFLVKAKWINAENLSLNEVVNDILSFNGKEV